MKIYSLFLFLVLNLPLWASETKVIDPLWDLKILPAAASQNIESGRVLLRSKTHQVGHGFTFGSREASKGKFLRISAKKREVAINKDFKGIELRTNLPYVKMVIKTKDNIYYTKIKGVMDATEMTGGIFHYKAVFSGMKSKDFDYFPIDGEITSLFIEAPLFLTKSALVYNLTYFGERASAELLMSSVE
jgi:hypothetical protein